MGHCWSRHLKAEKPFYSTSGESSKYESKDGNGSSSFSSKVSNASVPSRQRSEGEILKSSNVRNFTFNELRTATRNFRPDSIVGEGGFGAVFKGWIDEHTYAPAKPGTGMVIAVKKLNQEGFQGHKEWLALFGPTSSVSHSSATTHTVGAQLSFPNRTKNNFRQLTHSSATAQPGQTEPYIMLCLAQLPLSATAQPQHSHHSHSWCTAEFSKQNQEQFQAEVNYLGQLYHPNLVKLIGYCLEDEHRLLVYEFMPRGSLENHLFRRSSYFQPLSWNLRVKVALDAAKGLAFLHSAEIKVIYRDFKASNVLLDSNYNAKLSDFGLAKDGPTGDKSHVSTRVMGTHGYAAPEYLATGHLTTKSDVYSFGVVLLELLSGRRAIDKNRPQGEHNLVGWARPYLSNRRKVLSIMDNRLDGQYPRIEAQKVASITLQCLSSDSKFRPNMNQVVSSLDQLQNSTKKH